MDIVGRQGSTPRVELLRPPALLDDLEALDAGEIAFKEKLACFERAKHCFGRSALMLSGAGSLGAFHIGVARALAEQALVPGIVSGASAGSIVAAMLGTRRGKALARSLFEPDVRCSFDALRGTPEPFAGGGRIQLENLRAMIEWAVPDLTFIEAFEETGLRIDVSVAPSSLHQRSRLLNASTSPNAFIRGALLASCAIPGMFLPVTLAARDAEDRVAVPMSA